MVSFRRVICVIGKFQSIIVQHHYIEKVIQKSLPTNVVICCLAFQGTKKNPLANLLADRTDFKQNFCFLNFRSKPGCEFRCATALPKHKPKEDCVEFHTAKNPVIDPKSKLNAICNKIFVL